MMGTGGDRRLAERRWPATGTSSSSARVFHSPQPRALSGPLGGVGAAAHAPEDGPGPCHGRTLRRRTDNDGEPSTAGPVAAAGTSARRRADRRARRVRGPGTAPSPAPVRPCGDQADPPDRARRPGQQRPADQRPVALLTTVDVEQRRRRRLAAGHRERPGRPRRPRTVAVGVGRRPRAARTTTASVIGLGVGGALGGQLLGRAGERQPTEHRGQGGVAELLGVAGQLHLCGEVVVGGGEAVGDRQRTSRNTPSAPPTSSSTAGSSSGEANVPPARSARPPPSTGASGALHRPARGRQVVECDSAVAGSPSRLGRPRRRAGRSPHT